MTCSDKHSSLLRYGINYSVNEHASGVQKKDKDNLYLFNSTLSAFKSNIRKTDWRFGFCPLEGRTVDFVKIAQVAANKLSLLPKKQ